MYICVVGYFICNLFFINVLLYRCFVVVVVVVVAIIGYVMLSYVFQIIASCQASCARIERQRQTASAGDHSQHAQKQENEDISVLQHS